MDYKEYQTLYNKLLTEKGLLSIEDDVNEKEKVLDKINDFLGKYPTLLPKDRLPSTSITQLSVTEIYRRTLQTLIDIINELSEIISQKNYVSQATFRRRLFEVFTKPERRLYVGLMLVFLSFVLYFVDSAA
jgi:phosphoenolpyruvate carboxylase